MLWRLPVPDVAHRIVGASAETTEGRCRILDSGREVAVKLHDLGLSLHNVLRTSGKTEKRHVLVETSRLVARSVRDLVGCSVLLRGDKWAEADVIALATVGEGLISAARFVVAAVHQPCDTANTLVHGQLSEEKLISAAKQVASSTAQLLIACNVKADIDSQARKRLQAAGHAVKTATERLVESARHIVVQDERNIIIADRMVHGTAQAMDAQEIVARKEKKLFEVRQRLATIHKARYERDSSPSQ